MKFLLNAVLGAIPKSQILSLISSSLKRLVPAVEQLLVGFVQNVSPVSTLKLEQALLASLLSFGRDLVQQLYNSLEAATSEQPAVVKHRSNNYRKLEGKKPVDVVTRFGKITLMRTRYRRGRSGRAIFPIEKLLGLQRGFTPEAASLIGQQFAETGSSQGRTLAFVNEHLGCSIGTERLRKLGHHLAQKMEPFRERCQQEQLNQWLEDANKTGAKSVVLSVSRDAVSLGIAPFGYFEMASVATLSVIADGKRLGTVYLGRTPETNQKTLSRQLTSLLKLTLRSCSQRPHVVYVTDAGMTETAYWKNELSKFYVDGQRIKIHRVVDYYHASQRLTTVADCLKFGKAGRTREQWLEHARKLLLERGGLGRVMRSIATMKRTHGLKPGTASDYKNAIGYLNNQKRFMNYFELKERGFPIGSGVVESACKQIVSERMKLSGMRWKKPGAQSVMTLRCIKLSNIWSHTFDRMLQEIVPVDELSKIQNPVFTESNGA